MNSSSLQAAIVSTLVHQSKMTVLERFRDSFIIIVSMILERNYEHLINPDGSLLRC